MTYVLAAGLTPFSVGVKNEKDIPEFRREASISY